MITTCNTFPTTVQAEAAPDTMSHTSDFTHLFNSYRDELYRTALKITGSRTLAEDAVHNVFLKMWLKRSEIHLIRHLRAYLHTMIKNCILDTIKKQKCERSVINRLYSDYNGAEILQDRYALHQYDQLLHTIVQQMPSRQQQVYHFVKEQGLSYKVTADRLKISGLTVKKHISNAMEFIRNQFIKNGISPAGEW